ncbi:MAG: formate dehydrogenase accessory sulfurtransferase FdhD [Acidimicrobiia bacterium]|nr:MAG: formate dehydrogenase accessory sulfurtransferase FdhD [Acidimicrobiia bacterium]
MTAPEHFATRRVVRFGSTGLKTIEDRVAREEPMEILIGSTPIAVLMRTPGDDVDLTLGFALTEGIAIHPHELLAAVSIGSDDEDARYRLEFAAGVEVDPDQFKRNLYASSSCGVCGKASIDAVRIAAAAPSPGPQVDGASLDSLAATMRAAQPGFDATGGLHAAALFQPDGKLIALREDIGRHNAVDKVVGATSGALWPLSGHLLLVSGRVSFEIVQKAAVAGIPIVAGISAASSLAIDLAEELGMTVVGFMRGGSFNIYTGAERIGIR